MYADVHTIDESSHPYRYEILTFRGDEWLHAASGFYAVVTGTCVLISTDQYCSTIRIDEWVEEKLLFQVFDFLKTNGSFSGYFKKSSPCYHLYY